ncbi:MAG: glycerophosphodiester phosphodiesterase family protein [Thermoproteota archaeon]
MIAHRGASGHCPENTLKGIEEAISIGCDVVEIDLKVTRDGHIILMHDDYLDRTTNGRGEVKRATLDQIKNLDAGEGERVPLLTEVFERFETSGAKFMLDVSNAGFEERLVKVVKSFDFEDRSIFSGSHGPLALIKSLDPKLKIAPSFDRASREGVAKSLSMGADIYNCNYRTVSRHLVELAHRSGLQVIVWVVNDTDEMGKMIDVGVDGITTDYPDALLGVARRFVD